MYLKELFAISAIQKHTFYLRKNVSWLGISSRFITIHVACRQMVSLALNSSLFVLPVRFMF